MIFLINVSNKKRGKNWRYEGCVCKVGIVLKFYNCGVF